MSSEKKLEVCEEEVRLSVLQASTRISEIETEMSQLRASQPACVKRRAWSDEARQRYESLLSEKREKESLLRILKPRIRDLNRAATALEPTDRVLTPEQEEENKRRTRIRAAKLKLLAEIELREIDGAEMFLKYVANLLANLAADFNQDELSDDEWAAIKIFKEIIDS